MNEDVLSRTLRLRPKILFRARTPRAAARVGLIAASSVALVAAGLVTGPAQAASAKPADPYSPAYQHSYRHGAVPSQETSAKMKQWVAGNGQVVPLDSANNIQYNGGVDGIGVTTGKERVYLIFWGTQWGSTGTDGNGNTTFSGDSAGMAPRLQQLFKGVGSGGELWSGVMTQYCEGVAVGTQTCPLNSLHVGYPSGGALGGVWYDNSAAAPANATALQLGQEAVTAAGHFGNTNAILNRSAQYVVVSPSGTHPDGFPSTGFCAWHDWNGDVGASSSVGDIAFTNLPYVLDAGASCGANFVNPGSAGSLDGVTIVEGHEYAETVTDQNPAGGWTGPGDENGDKCAWIGSGQGAAADVGFTTGAFAMQSTWSNSFNGGTGGCEMSHPIVGQDPFTTGYVWNDRTSQAGCYQPSSFYSYNSRGSVNSICRTGVGTYLVHFADLASSGGNVQVSAYGSAASHCKVGYWVPSGTEEQVAVYCFSFSGAAQDSYFTTSFTAGGGSANTIAFAWANQPSTASYTPSSTYQYNNRGGGLATITRSGVGSYTVSFPDSFGPAAAGGVKVTAYGSTSGECNVTFWGPSGSNELVGVQCHNSAGSASDEYFSLVYVNGMNILGDNLTADAYAWANQPSTASYTPALAYQRSTTIASSGTVTITRAAAGTYDVFLPFQDQGLDGGHVEVTAYGSGTNRCQVGYWYGTTGGRDTRIYCFSNTGVLTDSYFAVQYTGRLQ
jgi:serine protease